MNWVVSTPITPPEPLVILFMYFEKQHFWYKNLKFFYETCFFFKIKDKNDKEKGLQIPNKWPNSDKSGKLGWDCQKKCTLHTLCISSSENVQQCKEQFDDV